MKLFEDTYLKVIEEQNLPKGKKTNQLVKAITNRNPITFYYDGPRSGKDGVKPGVRLRAEAVAMGLSKGGNIIVRMYVQPPSVSKKGYGETGWRTFRIDRMSNINVLDETFNEKRPNYKEGDESSQGPMVKTYVTTNWDDKEIVEPQQPRVEPEEPRTEPQQPRVEPEEPNVGDIKLPEPKIDDKPNPTPENISNDIAGDVFKNIQPKDVNGVKIISTQEFDDAVKKIYREKENEWSNQQKQLNKNTTPGQGTRRRFEISAKSELMNLLNKNTIRVSDEAPIENKDDLQESINRIKTLMLL
jgi:predicted DNA-binding transcriptional regulator YafY